MKKNHQSIDIVQLGPCIQVNTNQALDPKFRSRLCILDRRVRVSQMYSFYHTIINQVINVLSFPKLSSNQTLDMKWKTTEYSKETYLLIRNIIKPKLPKLQNRTNPSNSYNPMLYATQKTENEKRAILWPIDDNPFATNAIHSFPLQTNRG